jgi:CMP-N-acetylneuraminic acid synthetase
MKSDNILITICARGRSKGLPGKHLKTFRGKPLIAWTIDQAMQWGKGDIILSSDDAAILEQIKPEYGKIAFYVAHKRPKELAAKTTPKLDAIRDALMEAEKKTKKKYSIIIDLDATNPLRTTEDIEACANLFKRKMPHTVVSVVKSRRSPYFNMVEMVNGKVRLCKQSPKDTYRRQDVPYTYDLNCSIYVYENSWLSNKKNKSPITEKTELYVMPDETFCDIDAKLDFQIVEYLWNNFYGQNN